MRSKAQAPHQQYESGKTPLWAIGLVIFSTLLLSASQILLKIVSLQGIGEIFTSPLLYAGMCCLIIAGVTITFSLKHGDLSVLYPFIALGFIWVTIVGVLLFKEQLAPSQLFGTLLIMTGVSVIGHRRNK